MALQKFCLNKLYSIKVYRVLYKLDGMVNADHFFLLLVLRISLARGKSCNLTSKTIGSCSCSYDSLACIISIKNTLNLYKIGARGRRRLPAFLWRVVSTPALLWPQKWLSRCRSSRRSCCLPSFGTHVLNQTSMPEKC